jgi:hypothetical protein
MCLNVGKESSSFAHYANVHELFFEKKRTDTPHTLSFFPHIDRCIYNYLLRIIKSHDRAGAALIC